MEMKKVDLVACQGASTSFVEKPALNETQLVLKRALELLGPNGEHWYQGDYCNGAGDALCALGALDRAHGVGFGGLARDNLAADALLHAAEEMGFWSGHTLNDMATHFGQVRAMFEKAIALAATQAGHSAAP